MNSSKARTERFTLRDTRVALHSFAGGGPALFSLHGFTGSGLDFAALSERFDGELYCPDLPGHGSSDRLPPRATEISGIEVCADTLVELANDAALILPSLLGYSMGGRTALTLALRHPGAVGALVLISASPGLAAVTERAQRRDLDEQRALALEQQGTAAFMEHWQDLPLLRSQRRMPASYWHDFSERRREADPAGLAWSLRAMGTGSMPPLWDRLGEVSVPTLLITGAEDERYTAIATKMAAKIPGAVCEVIAGAGHSPHFERPQAVADLLDAFLR
jgi:2-succinyl-6-hydroxy-2,4-cyclohexadiene-1-carboxylate synthase